MNLVERARAICLSPAATWPVIEQESTDYQQLFVPYMVILAAIPAVATFIGMSIIGIGGFGMSFRVPFVNGLGMMISQYIMTLVMVFAWGWLISALAPTFGGQPNVLQGVKLSVYASTPSMLAGVFGIIPTLGVLSILGGLYALYLVYLGLPVLMKNPSEKTLPYMAVTAVIGIIGSILIGVVGSVLSPAHRMGALQMGAAGASAGGPAAISINTPQGSMQISGSGNGNGAVTLKSADGEVKIDVQQMEEMAKRMQELAQQQQGKQ